ncbi:MAG TPA: CoA transferase, partial [Dehalococcoidia bacterium]|nr:CoA transferase [Dehalococcoidia bacterium]
GDPLRDIGPFWHDERAAGRSLSFLNNNTNKRSVTLDITEPDGRALFQRLVATADAVVETYAPGYLDRLGLGYAALEALRAGIILTSVTGFGQTGPHAGYAWSDVVGVAMSGMMTLAGDKDDPPNMPASSQGYIGASIQAACGTLMALTYRDRTGEGQHVDVSMQEALSINQETAMQTYDMMKAIRTRTGARGAIPIDLPGLGTFECADGHVFAYLGTPGGAPWTVMLDWMNREGLAEDLNDEPYKGIIAQLNLRFLTTLMNEPEKLPERLKALAHMHGVFSRFCKSMGKWTIYEEGQKQRLMFGIVSTPDDIVNSPQLVARGWLTDVRHDDTGETLRYPGPPYRLSGTPWSIRRRPPLPGEHNVEIYGELGVETEELAALRSRGIV